MIYGGCYCGAIRYQAGGEPFHRTHCHCENCRRISGAPFVSWFSVHRADFRVLHGEPRRFRSSDLATRSFCPDCGTPLTFEHDAAPGEIDVTICSLDDPERLAPLDQTWVERRLGWIAAAPALPEFRRGRSEG